MFKAQEQQQTNTIHKTWSNYETKLSSLWLTNDQANYSILTEALKIEIEKIDKANWLEQRMRWQLEDEISESSLWQDLLNCAFDHIGWVEVIEKNFDYVRVVLSMTKTTRCYQCCLSFYRVLSIETSLLLIKVLNASDKISRSF